MSSLLLYDVLIRWAGAVLKGVVVKGIVLKDAVLAGAVLRDKC
ncbi:hypothetical protein [Glaciimonas sp. PAMC28666]|nr:hypothetical protein [Glaciimonas sp. PAMC28666]